MADRLGTEAGFTDFLRTYPTEMVFSEEGADVVFDRYHCPDAVYLSDGVRLDRERVIAHARPVRKNVEQCVVEVHDVVVGDRRAAARYTLAAKMRKGKEVVTTVAMFCDLAPDGRIARVDQMTTQS